MASSGSTMVSVCAQFDQEAGPESRARADLEDLEPVQVAEQPGGLGRRRRAVLVVLLGDLAEPETPLVVGHA